MDVISNPSMKYVLVISSEVQGLSSEAPGNAIVFLKGFYLDGEERP